MKVALPLLTLVMTLTGCTVGSEVTGREADLSKPFPDLHTVPDRPAAPNFAKIELERDSFEEGHESMLEQNQAIRERYKAPEKASTSS